MEDLQDLMRLRDQGLIITINDGSINSTEDTQSD